MERNWKKATGHTMEWNGPFRRSLAQQSAMLKLMHTLNQSEKTEYMSGVVESIFYTAHNGK